MFIDKITECVYYYIVDCVKSRQRSHFVKIQQFLKENG